MDGTGDVASRDNEETTCCLRKVPNSGAPCNWSGRWNDQFAHFFLKHRSLIHYYNVVIMEPDTPKLVAAHNDMFIAYAAYHKEDLACIVMHTCNCTTSYYYRCTLLTSDINESDIKSPIVPTFTKVKKFRSIRKHKHVTRFSPAQLDSRRDSKGNINILIEIFGPGYKGAVTSDTQGHSSGGGKDDSPEEDRSSDEENIPSKKRKTSGEAMNAVCGMSGFGDKGQQCSWRGTKEQLPQHLLKEHAVHLGIYGHCSKDFEDILPLLSYRLLAYQPSYAPSFGIPSLFDHVTYKPSNCVVKINQRLCCYTIMLPNENWRYGWPREMGDIVYAMMWDEFRPTIILNIPKLWVFVPVMGAYPCHIVHDSSELEQLTLDNCPCRTPTSKRLSNKPHNLAHCALNYVPGKIGLCNWIGSSDMLYDHLLSNHQSLVRHDDKIILQIEQPRILCAYRDTFLCYIAYDRGDVVCVVLHACSCSKIYMYRCTLLSEMAGLCDVDGNMRFVINACKDFKYLIHSADITRFPRPVVEPRKNQNGKVSAVLTIYPPIEEEAQPKPSPKFTNPWSNLLSHRQKVASGEAAKLSTYVDGVAQSPVSTYTGTNLRYLEEGTTSISIPPVAFAASELSIPKMIASYAEQHLLAKETGPAQTMFSSSILEKSRALNYSDPEESTSSLSALSSPCGSERSTSSSPTVNPRGNPREYIPSPPNGRRLYSPQTSTPISTGNRVHHPQRAPFTPIVNNDPTNSMVSPSTAKCAGDPPAAKTSKDKKIHFARLFY